MERGGFRYQPALDGLRAFAVSAVIAYHLGYDWAGGGFLGVDTFFVLSGFLITSLLLRERDGTGRISLAGFWARRARRLLPAVFLLLIVVVAFGAATMNPIELDQLRGDAIASLFYVANWHFIATDQSYFAVFLSPSPLQHLWSLAIEEQFYLLWPLIVVAVMKLTSDSRRAMFAVVIAGIAISQLSMALLYDERRPVACVLRHRGPAAHDPRRLPAGAAALRPARGRSAPAQGAGVARHRRVRDRARRLLHRQRVVAALLRRRPRVLDHRRDRDRGRGAARPVPCAAVSGCDRCATSAASRTGSTSGTGPSSSSSRRTASASVANGSTRCGFSSPSRSRWRRTT